MSGIIACLYPVYDITSVFLLWFDNCLTDNFATAMYGLKLLDTSWLEKCPSCRGETMVLKGYRSGAGLLLVFLVFSELLLCC